MYVRRSVKGKWILVRPVLVSGRINRGYKNQKRKEKFQQFQLGCCNSFIVGVFFSSRCPLARSEKNNGWIPRGMVLINATRIFQLNVQLGNWMIDWLFFFFLWAGACVIKRKKKKTYVSLEGIWFIEEFIRIYIILIVHSTHASYGFSFFYRNNKSQTILFRTRRKIISFMKRWFTS